MASATRGDGWKARRILLPSSIVLGLSGSGAPTNGTSGTGATVAGPGSIYIRTSNGAWYTNTNTKASPTWTLLPAPTAQSINTAALDPTTIQYASVALSAAAIITLNSVPVSVVPSPGAGKALIVHDCMMSMTYGSVQFTGGGVVSFVDHGGHNAVHTATGILANTVKAAASFAKSLGGLSANDGSTRPLATGIDIEAATADFAAGNSTGKAHVWYSVATA